MKVDKIPKVKEKKIVKMNKVIIQIRIILQLVKVTTIKLKRKIQVQVIQLKVVIKKQ